MGFKKFLIGFIKNLIVLLVATLVFSSVTLDFPVMMKDLFGDIFTYASPDVQKQVISQLTETCSSLGQGGKLVTINQICADRSLLESMKKDCADYRELKKNGIRVENEAEIMETCRQIESGEIERACEEIGQKKSFVPDFSNIGTLCMDYKSGKINDREFFFNVIGGAIPAQMPDIGALDKYSRIINYLNKNKILYFVILAILLILLYLLIADIKLLTLTLAGTSFSIGILIMLPYLAIIAYEKFAGFDTTSILGSMFGIGGFFDFKAIISVILLLFLRTYTPAIITLGITFLVAGIAGKVYVFVLRRKGKVVETEIKTKATVKTKKKKKS